MTNMAQTFLQGTLEQRLQLIRTQANSDVLRGLLGMQGYEQYQALARRWDERHLAAEAPKNLIFLPGIMGSLLHSVTRAGVWWIDVRTLKHIEDLRLASDGVHDIDPASQVEPFGVDYAYDPFLCALLSRTDFGHEIFPYDWRKPPHSSAERLRDLVLHMHVENGGRPVHLVAHSMGGLVIRAALMEYGDVLWPKIGRIVFIATPHYGAPAIAGYLKNHLWGFDLMAFLGCFLTPQTFRSLWGALALLPAPYGVYPGTRLPSGGSPGDHPCANFNMYLASEWHLSLSQDEELALQGILDDASAYQERLYAWHDTLDQLQRDRMLVIAGVGYKTLFRLAYEDGFLGLWEHTTKETKRVEGDPNREGDGSVPLASAMLEDVQVRYVRGDHASLPNMPAVYKDTLAWLNKTPLALAKSPQAALSKHLGVEDASAAPALDGTLMSGDPLNEDLGRWNDRPLDPNRRDVLKKLLEQEQLPELTRVRLL